MEKYILFGLNIIFAVVVGIIYKLVLDKIKANQESIRNLYSKNETINANISNLDKAQALHREALTETSDDLKGSVKRFHSRVDKLEDKIAESDKARAVIDVAVARLQERVNGRKD